MRTQVQAANIRRVLCIFPAYAPAGGTFSHAFRLVGAQAFMPPQGLLLIANYLPPRWPVRFIDENMQRAQPADFAWADAVFVTGMDIQAAEIHDVCRRAKACGKVTVLGGPSVSAAPERYPDFDYLHIGELSEATDYLVARLDATVAAAPRQIHYLNAKRRALTELPCPAYHLIQFDKYLLGTLQFSSPQQLIDELDVILSQRSHPASLYFVDDNLIANATATREMLPHLVAWQKRNAYPVSFCCEATLDLARHRDILAMMREARFDAVFVGIEAPQLDASLPMLEAIQTLNSYGLEVPQIPMPTMNLLQALPETALWDRLARDGRLVERFTHQIESTYANRLATPGAARLTRSNLKRSFTLVANLLIRVGLFADYRRPFWRMAWQAIRHGQFEALFGVGFIAYHLIEISREAPRGQQNASFYSARALARRP
jgi:hopanoid C-2 methylase